MNPILQEIQVKSVITKSNLPVCNYSVNLYTGCTHGCKYCYASFMKRFTGHEEDRETFLDIKYWPVIRNPHKYDGKTRLEYVVNDDTMHKPFETDPAIVNFFYHSEIKKSAKEKR
jgi:DNA repair photolyase